MVLRLFLALVISSPGFPTIAQSSASTTDTLGIYSLKQQIERARSEGQYAIVLKAQTQLRDLYQQRSQWKNAWEAEVAVATANYRLSDIEASQSSLKRALLFADQHRLRDPLIFSDLHNLYGVLFYEQGDYQQAIKHLKTSIAYLNRITPVDEQDMADRYNNLAAIISRMGDYDEAIFYYNQSLQLRLKKNDPLAVGESYNNLSVSYYRKKLFPEALQFQLKYLALLGQVRDKDLTIEYILCYNSLGIYYLELKSYEQAQQVLDRALKLSMASSQFLEKSYHNLGYLHRTAGNDSLAFHFLQQALALNQKKYKKGHPDIGKEYRHLGVIYMRRNDELTAMRCFQKALSHLVYGYQDSSFFSNPVLENIKSKPDLLRTLADKAQALRILSQKNNNARFLDASLKTYQTAIDLIEKMRDDYESEAARQFVHEEAMPIYAGALETIHTLHQQREAAGSLAFEVMEQSKALLLMESLQQRRNADAYGVPDSLLRNIKQLHNTIAFYKKQLQEDKAKNDSAALARDWNYCQNFQAQEHQMNLLFQQRYPRYWNLRNKFEISPLEKVKELTRNEGTDVVEYFITDSELYLFIVQNGNIKFIKKERTEEINAWLAKYQRSLTDYEYLLNSPIKNYHDYTESAHGLFNFLLSDVAGPNETSIRKILIVPHDVLASVPFEALLSKTASKSFQGYAGLDYLIKTASVSYTYSLTMHLALMEQRNISGAGSIAFANNFSRAAHRLEQLPILRHAERELVTVNQTFKGEKYVNEKATKSIFVNEVSRYNIVHIASHAVMDDREPANSHIYFSGNGANNDQLVYAYEIANLSMSADMVVLSACETGSGKSGGGEGRMSIGRSFMYAGAKSVIMNLWRAEDQANAEIMVLFYKNLAQGNDKVSSLQNAKYQYLQGMDEFRAHPFFWAGYVLYGHEATITQGVPSLQYILLILISILLFSAAQFLFHRKPIPVQSV
ncbi:MAG: CHAT domain-containing protein [Bacteroidota bacterium]